MTFKGYVDAISHLGVEGWAVDLSGDDLPVEVAILVNGQPHGTCLAARDRPGLGTALGGKVSDRHGFSYRFDPVLTTERDISITVVYAADRTPIENGHRLLRGALRPRTPLVPILLTSRGRSGSTLLMSELAAHPDIAVADTYPFEIKLLSYYISALKVLTASQYGDNPDFVEEAAEQMRIGGNPWNRPDLLHAVGGRHWTRLFQTSMPDRLADLFRGIIADAYGSLAIERGKADARFFAEKTPIDADIRTGARSLFPEVRELVLVRDPRDYVCSARLFWRQNTASVLDTLDRALPALEGMQRAAGPDTLFVRYEDLVLTPVKTRRAIYDFLGLSLPSAEVAARAAAIPEGHATSDSPADSIGRWRKELSATEVAACNTRYRGFLERFGYPAS